jgi:hypothetical protein
MFRRAALDRRLMARYGFATLLVLALRTFLRVPLGSRPAPLA